MLKGQGIACQFVIAAKPVGAQVIEITIKSINIEDLENQ